MSQPGLASQKEQKQQLNVYTMMLIIAFIAICIGCILLYNELQRFGSPFQNPPPWNTSGARASLVIPAETPQRTSGFDVRLS